MTGAVQILKGLTRKKYVYLTQRGNKSILFALKIAKALGYKKVLIQDQGGWITYLQFPERLGMELVKLKTDYGFIEPDELAKELDGDCVLLINSLTGYFAEQPIGLLYSMCKQKDAFLINDASGTIGTELAKVGDIVIGSFGGGKPIDLDYGGFIAFNEREFSDKVSIDEVFDKDKAEKLAMKLEELPDRLRFLEDIHNKIKKDLETFDIIHRGARGINVIVKFKDEFEKERIINYCQKNAYEWTECPRYIRVNTDAISIEVKRL